MSKAKKEATEEVKEFRINEYLTLRLLCDETVIFVKNEEFMHCKYLLLNIPNWKIYLFDEVNSIDEAEEVYDRKLERPYGRDRKVTVEITPEEEFRGHCSNLQVWAEYNYDTRLLHSNLSFPLLKKLYEAGDPIAKKRFKEELFLRIKNGDARIHTMLLHYSYLKVFTYEELETLSEAIKADSILDKRTRTLNNIRLIKSLEELNGDHISEAQRKDLEASLHEVYRKIPFDALSQMKEYIFKKEREEPKGRNKWKYIKIYYYFKKLLAYSRKHVAAPLKRLQATKELVSELTRKEITFALEHPAYYIQYSATPLIILKKELSQRFSFSSFPKSRFKFLKIILKQCEQDWFSGAKYTMVEAKQKLKEEVLSDADLFSQFIYNGSLIGDFETVELLMLGRDINWFDPPFTPWIRIRFTYWLLFGCQDLSSIAPYIEKFKDDLVYYLSYLNHLFAEDKRLKKTLWYQASDLRLKQKIHLLKLLKKVAKREDLLRLAYLILQDYFREDKNFEDWTLPPVKVFYNLINIVKKALQPTFKEYIDIFYKLYLEKFNYPALKEVIESLLKQHPKPQLLPNYSRFESKITKLLASKKRLYQNERKKQQSLENFL